MSASALAVVDVAEGSLAIVAEGDRIGKEMPSAIVNGVSILAGMPWCGDETDDIDLCQVCGPFGVVLPMADVGGDSRRVYGKMLALVDVGGSAVQLAGRTGGFDRFGGGCGLGSLDFGGSPKVLRSLCPRLDSGHIVKNIEDLRVRRSGQYPCKSRRSFSVVEPG